MPGGRPGHLPRYPRAQSGTRTLTGLSLGGGSEDEQDQERQGLQEPRHFWAEAGERLDPAPGGELLSPAAIVPALCTQGNRHLYWPQEDKVAPSTMATWLLSPLAGGTTPLAQAPAPHHTQRPPPPGAPWQRTGTSLGQPPGGQVDGGRDRQVGGWVGAQVEGQMGDGVEKCPPCLVPPIPGRGWQGWGRSPRDGVAQRGGECQATPSPPLGTSQLPPDNPRRDPIMSSGSA